MNDEKKNEYYNRKKYAFFIFDDYRATYKLNPWLFEIDNLRKFQEVINYFIERKIMSKSMKNNIFNILVYAREIEDDNRVERINIINEIINSVNTSIDHSISFYIEEFLFRKNIKKIDFYVEDLVDEIPNIHDSIVNDFQVLITHSENCSDEVFESEYLNQFVDNSLYFESLNCILRDCTCMFDDKIFLQRIRLVLQHTKYKTKEYKRIDKLVKTRTKLLDKLD